MADKYYAVIDTNVIVTICRHAGRNGKDNGIVYSFFAFVIQPARLAGILTESIIVRYL